MPRGPRGIPPLSPGDVVVADYRVPPFYKDETLIVDEVKNLGTRGNPYWRAHLQSQRGVSGWLDATSMTGRSWDRSPRASKRSA